jgi:ATP-dependent helicase/nuclease subunit B
MGLRIVYGRAGSGKTSFCLKEIGNALNTGEPHPLVLIIPEQFSLQAEKNLARATGSAGIFRAEVLSFRRLAFRVFSEVGGISKHHLNAAGKSMLLFKIMNGLGTELRMLSRAALRRGFMDTLSDTITELKRYDIVPEELEKAAARLEDGVPLKDKLGDLARVYWEFEYLLHQNYMDADDDLAELFRKLDQSAQFNGAEIWIDEFSGFTPQEYKVIGKLLTKAKRVTVSLCTDCLSNEPGDGAPLVFTPVRNTAVKLAGLAAKEGIEVENPVALDGWPGSEAGFAAVPGNAPQRAAKTGYAARFAASEELGHLERNFYKYPCSKYARASGDVTIASAANPYSEVEEAARDIIRLCRDQGYRYRDIAVTMRNPESYGSSIKSIFSRFGIPFFFDGKRNIDSHPLVVFILSALEIFSDSWSYEAVFRYARTGLAGVAREELDLLENYVLANGIRGNVWLRQEDWDYPVEQSNRQDKPDPREQECLARINRARRQLVGPLEAFRRKTKGGAGAVEFCTALFELLCATGANQAMEDLSARFVSEGRLDKADEYRQVWNAAMEVFSQIVEVLGQEEMGTERFSEILAAGFAGHKIGLIPPAMDQVLVGSMERARSHDIKALYILGANEGVLPGTKSDDGLISDTDRDNLGKLGLELAGNTAGRSMEERFMVYRTLATPSKYLRLSYPAADRDGKALRPSRILPEIRRILPQVRELGSITGSAAAPIPEPAAPEPAFDELVASLRMHYDGVPIHDGWKAVYKWFSTNSDWSEKCSNIVNGLDYTNQTRPISRGRAVKLYGKPVFTSVSRMEAYSSCPFSYFVKYGLKAKERRLFSFNPVDAGTFMHNSIDEFSRMLVRDGISWRGLDREWCAEQISQLVDGQLSKGSVLGSSRRYAYLSGRLKRTLTKAILLIGSHIERSSFEPSGYEVEFGDDGRYPPIAIELPSGETVRMTGRIDRIDSMTNEDGTWLRIIDYKSGDRALKLADVYYGLQLQLVTYMDAVLGMENAAEDGTETRLPAGILYFRLDDPLIRCDRESTGEEIEKAIMKELRMKGLILADVKLVREMDRQIDGDSLIVPARINKDGSLGRSSAATMEQFGVLREYVRQTLATIGSGILEGNIAINPYKKRTLTACTYCSFSSVCQFDTSIRDNRYRLLSDVQEDDVWKLMRSAGKQGDKGTVADQGQGGQENG